MNRQVAQFTSDPSRQCDDLLPAPAQHAREQSVAVGLDGLEHVDLVVAAEVFEFGVFGPRALRELYTFELVRQGTGAGDRSLLCKSLP